MFSKKFHLLNSQEHSEDINWSSSSSSEYENTSCNNQLFTVNKTQNRKRKRKKKVHKNISNLDIMVLDANKNIDKEKSPVLVSKSVCRKSPILTSSIRFAPTTDITNSPVLNERSICPKSPIITSKYASPKSMNVCKKLFCGEKRVDCDNHQKKLEDGHQNDSIVVKSEYSTILESTDSFTSSKSELSLIKNVKTFFENNFSSENTSQHISDTPTPEESSKSDDIDILSCKTQLSNNLLKPERNSSETSSDYNSKKIRYKKGGLAYRLSVLLKKHNANVRLWQHERFLAANCSFVIPKGEHLVFHIQNSIFKYDCYLLDAMDLNDEKYLILINNLYVTSNIVSHCILKLYEPFKILDKNQSCKIIINVCKFEIVDFKKELN